MQNDLVKKQTHMETVEEQKRLMKKFVISLSCFGSSHPRWLFYLFSTSYRAVYIYVLLHLLIQLTCSECIRNLTTYLFLADQVPILLTRLCNPRKLLKVSPRGGFSTPRILFCIMTIFLFLYLLMYIIVSIV